MLAMPPALPTAHSIVVSGDYVNPNPILPRDFARRGSSVRFVPRAVAVSPCDNTDFIPQAIVSDPVIVQPVIIQRDWWRGNRHWDRRDRGGLFNGGLLTGLTGLLR